MAGRKRGGGRMEREISLYGRLFAVPWICGLILFYAYPLLSSIYYSFTDYSIVNPFRWVGLENYENLLRDATFWTSVRNTLIFALMQVPLSMIVGIGLALLLNLRLKGQGLFRTLFFIPSLVPVIATVILWQWLLNPQFGLVNSVLDAIGLPGPPWLGDPDWAKPSLVLMTLWTLGNALLIYLAGLQDISQDYYDAADMDGANGFRKAWHITLPLLTPVIFFNMVVGLIHALQEFTMPYALTYGTGNPAESLLFYSMYLYNNAFLYMKMGYASAMAWILFIIIVAATLAVFRSSNRWVFYQDDES